MKNLYKKVISFLFVFLMAFGFTGCSSKEHIEVKSKAKTLAKEYIKDKYNQKFKTGKVYAKSIGNIWEFPPPTGETVVFAKNNDYSVYVDVRSGEIGDDIEVLKLKEDILKETLYKEFDKSRVLNYSVGEDKINDIVYIDNLKIMDGDYKAISFYGGEYFDKEFRYNGEDLKSFLQENRISVEMKLRLFLSEDARDDLEEIKAKFYNVVTSLSNIINDEYSSIEVYIDCGDEPVGSVLAYNYPQKMSRVDNPEFLNNNWYVGEMASIK